MQTSNQLENIPVQIYENLKQDPSSLFQNGKIDIRSYAFTQGGYSINLSDADAVKELIQKMQSFYESELNAMYEVSAKGISSLQQQLENERSKYETLKKNLQTEHDAKLEQYQKAIDENKKYKEWYGTLISPILIVKELWNEGQKGELDILVPPSRWKTGKGLGGEAGTTAKRYWISMLMEWKLIKQWGRGEYMANVGMYEALEMLNKMMKKQNLIPPTVEREEE